MAYPQFICRINLNSMGSEAVRPGDVFQVSPEDPDPSQWVDECKNKVAEKAFVDAKDVQVHRIQELFPTAVVKLFQ